MPRSLALLLLAWGTASAAIWPEHLGSHTRKSGSVVDRSTDDQGHWVEYGLQMVESANYGAFEVTASQFKDTTGAYAASLESPGILVGNYLITCHGHCPKDLSKLAEALPRVSHAPIPTLGAYLPVKGRIARSERYILGPATLRAFAPQVPPEAAAFQFSTEGELARYRTPQGDETVVIFSYPTPQIARQQAAEFQKLPGAVVKRSGHLVALVPGAKAPGTAEGLLGQISYHASVSWDEKPPIVVKPQSVGKMLLGIFTLTGFVLAFCVLSGLVFGGYRMLSRRFGSTSAQEPMILLHLGDK